MHAKAFCPGIRGIQSVKGHKGESFSLSFERKDNMVSRVSFPNKIDLEQTQRENRNNMDE
jgi:hypothetical protein